MIISTDSSLCRNILDTIGETPLVQFDRFLERNDVNLFAKLEMFNPGGSAKDRPALHMLCHAIENGEISSDSTIIESSSGNMGIGLAQVCRYYDLHFICVVDPHIQPQNSRLLEAYGVEVRCVQTPINGSYLTARLAEVERLLRQKPNSFWPNQYANTMNPEAHRLGTIVEIDEALNGQYDYLFVATSSTGTLQGCEDFLRERRRSTQVVAVDALGSVLFGGEMGERKIPGLGAGQIPPLAQYANPNSVSKVTDLDCVVGCRRLAKTEAVLAGGSAGGVLQAIRKMQNELAGKTCVAILHDSGTRYLDTVFSDRWVEQSLDCPMETVEAMASDHDLTAPIPSSSS